MTGAAVPYLSSLGWAALAVFAGGVVKGIAALGLPLVAIPLATLAVGLKHAVALLVMPMFGANLVQSFQGGMFRRSARQFRVLAPTVFLFVLLGTRILVSVPQRSLELVIGAALIVLPILIRLRPNFVLRERQRRWSDPLAGAVSGLLGGISAYYGPPLMLYVMGLRLPKVEFVSGISLLYWIAGLGLMIGVYVFGAADLPLLGWSLAMLVPAWAGMWLGRRVQVRLSETAFSRVLMVVYLVTGVIFLVEALA
ncbi:MAG: sulfite exporter TauE/SafE family protein [Stellaceae bacterium]